MDGLVSIIIPVYNTPVDKLRRCIDSVLGQTMDRLEVILVDDGSGPQCASELDEAARKDSRVRVIHKRNEGSAIARNTGIKEAAGEYVTFVDSDDCVFPYMLEDACTRLDQYGADISMGLIRRFHETDIGNDIGIRDYTGLQKDGGTQAADIRIVNSKEGIRRFVNHILGYPSGDFLFDDGYISDGPVARVCRKTILEKALFSEESCWNDDTIWNLNLLRFCHSIVISGKTWYAYVINMHSKTRRYRPDCPAEFAYRICQEKQIVDAMWPECRDGLYHRIRSDMALLCRTYLFHESNPSGWKERYDQFLRAANLPEYQEMLCHIDLSGEPFTKRIYKALQCFLSLHGSKAAAYLMWYMSTARNI